MWKDYKQSHKITKGGSSPEILESTQCTEQQADPVISCQAPRLSDGNKKSLSPTIHLKEASSTKPLLGMNQELRYVPLPSPGQS